MTKTPSDVLKLAKDKGARIVDLKFIDFIGTWQHFQIPVHRLDDAAFEDGVYFDGSSIRAWQTIDMSDMTVVRTGLSMQIAESLKTHPRPARRRGSGHPP